MKTLIYIISLICMGFDALAQTAPATSDTKKTNADVKVQTPSSTNPTGVYQTSPSPSSSSDYNNSSTAPGGLKQSNKYGTEEPAMSTEPTVNQPYDDYHLSSPTRPSNNTSTQTADPAVPLNDAAGVRPPNNNGMIRVDQNRIPYPLRETLKDDRYKGWENSIIYYDGLNKQYSIDIGNENEAQNYKFDEDGNVVNPQMPRQ